MKTPFLRAALVCAALMSTAAQAQQVYRFHSEGGNAQSRAAQRRLDQVISQYSADSPFGADASDDISIWCRDVIAILDQSERRANNDYASDRIVEAAQQLRDGLKKAMEHLGHGTYGRSITAKTVWYGNVLAKKLAPVAQTAQTNMRTYSLFLSEYYKLVRTAYEIDSNYSFEDGNCFECRDSRLKEFEERLIKLAQNELKVVNDGMLVPGAQQPIPLGSSNGAMYLTAMTLTLAFSADVLESSPYRNAYACVIGELLDLHDNLVNGSYSGPVEAVEETAWETRRIIPRISFHSCWGGGFTPADNGEDGPNGPNSRR